MSTELTLSGMTCEGCEAVVEYAAELADGVESAEADRYDATLTFDGPADRAVVAEKVEMAGYGVDE
jgi:copper chaperone CopZ